MLKRTSDQEEIKSEMRQNKMMAYSILEFCADGTCRELLFLDDDVTEDQLKAYGIQPVILEGKRYMHDKTYEWKLEGDELMIKDRSDNDFNAFTNESGPWRKALNDEGKLSMAEGMTIYTKD